MFTVYTTSAFRCPYCERAKAKLTELGYPFDERDVADPETRQELIARRPSVRTVPQIFLAAEYIGDCDELFRLIEAGALEMLIADHQTTQEVTTPLG